MTDLYLSRHRFVCFVPSLDRSGLWPVLTWAWFTVEVLPPGVGKRVADLLAMLRLKE